MPQATVASAPALQWVITLTAAKLFLFLRSNSLNAYLAVTIFGFIFFRLYNILFVALWGQTPGKMVEKVIQGAAGRFWLIDATAWQAEIDPSSLNYVLAQQKDITRRIRERLDLPMDGSMPQLFANNFSLETENRRRAEQGLPPRPGGDPTANDPKFAQQNFVGQKTAKI